MDCLALRKSSGTITGEVRLNGHPQEPLSFRRCTGYVEQFDVQSPCQTIRETVEFSARLRLDENDSNVTDESIKLFIDQTLAMLELTAIQDLLVGSDLSGGLSFEQRKRLSICVELGTLTMWKNMFLTLVALTYLLYLPYPAVSNPSILFLDEPTSGLDARAAGIVMRGLKRIAESGRAVCATIHQPSIAIFNDFDSLLLLQRGGQVVFFGELGDESCKLIEYFERFDSTKKIRPGENPATWMLTTTGAGSSSSGTEKPFDYAGNYSESTLRKNALKKIDEFNSNPSDENKVHFANKFSSSLATQRSVFFKRIMTIYWRSPSYNTVRLLVSAVVAFLFGSVYASQRTPENESDMNSRVTSIYITFLFLAVNAFNTVLAIYETERNMFYRHKAALMYSERAIILGFTLAELPFILMASLTFCICFYFLVGFSLLAYKFFLYFLFFTLNLALWTFTGQMMMSLVKDAQTAQGFGGLLISLTSLFSGLLIRPQNITGFWTFMYWLMPGHYVLEGLIASQFHQDDTPIVATVGSPFYTSLGCDGTPDYQCIGTAEQWIADSFGGKFNWNHVPWNVVYLLVVLFAVRIINYFALVKLNYLAK
jgi:ABC-type multidrug transport system ATPase subunit